MKSYDKTQLKKDYIYDTRLQVSHFVQRVYLLKNSKPEAQRLIYYFVLQASSFKPNPNESANSNPSWSANLLCR